MYQPLEPSFIHVSTTRALLHSCIKVPGTRAPPPPHTKSPSHGWGAHVERCPHPETFLTCLPGSPVNKFPPYSWYSRVHHRVHNMPPYLLTQLQDVLFMSEIRSRGKVCLWWVTKDDGVLVIWRKTFVLLAAVFWPTGRQTVMSQHRRHLTLLNTTQSDLH